MKSNIKQKQFYIEVNDIFDELSEENKRLNNVLMFANNCLNVLNKFKLFLNKICLIFESNLKSEDKQELNQLENEFNSIIDSKENLKENNVLIENNISENNRNIDKNCKNFDYELSDNESSTSSNQSTTSDQSYQNNDTKVKSKSSERLNTRKIRKCLPKEELNSMKTFLRNTFDETTQRYVCPFPSCDKSYIVWTSLHYHWKNTHDPNRVETDIKPIICDFIGCDYRCKTQSHLDSHKVKHSDVRPFVCNKCLKAFKTNSILKCHQKSVHSSVGQYVCTFGECSNRYKFNHYLQNHIRRAHTLEKPFQCIDCGKTFFTKRDLINHRQTHSDLTFECEECHKLFNREILLKSHQRIHASNRKTFSCDFCNFKTTNKSYLKSHIRLSHVIKDRTIKCDFEGCPKVFKDKKSMKNHKRAVHQKKERVPCDWPGCDKTFKNQFYANDHKRTHLGTREFLCEVEGCGKAFMRKHTLGAHKEWHRKRFICSWPECDQRFPDIYLLNEHLNRHQNIKPFKCTFNGCPKEYFSRLSLRFHLKTVHKNQTNV